MILQRCASYFGTQYVQDRLRAPQQVMTLFSGIECARAAWGCIEAAAWSLWGIRCELKFVCAETCLILNFNNSVFSHVSPPGC